MKRTVATLALCGVLAVLAACGPLVRPMAMRLDDEGQKQMDEAWNKALSPVAKLDRQTWLDVFVGAQAYQYGVDRLEFRSEKDFSGGKVVMEVHYDQATPEVDRFAVTVLDHAGKQLRHERYSREDVEKTYHDLFVQPQGAKLNPNMEQRWEEIFAVFPNAQKPEGQQRADP